MWVHVMVQQKGAEPGSEGWNRGKAQEQKRSGRRRDDERLTWRNLRCSRRL